MSSDRRLFLLSALALGACGFTPAYGPSGGASALQGQVRLDAPGGRASYLLNQRLEERLGHAPTGRYALSYALKTGRDDLGTTSEGVTSRYHLSGSATWSLTDTDERVVASGKVDSFSSYSPTGSTVATRASQRDATARLMIILADQLVDQLLLQASDLPA
ncbi:LPS assembly lipoprotein LptE [Primorskyibacter flagellatus]|uniref:LPS-assembly lipoprotein n=1 Tax=Primorskyibacter flagellatus TaxID=1387277 RepID=A0A1W1ZUH6_9RHOB|nr:LPS assembly lipoprotein LptE [Primorskyibacter flagellatus]SMC52057.1 LPS-assembly lipoprotein [Primorskyibacter flagellatus]